VIYACNAALTLRTCTRMAVRKTTTLVCVVIEHVDFYALALTAATADMRARGFTR